MTDPELDRKTLKTVLSLTPEVQDEKSTRARWRYGLIAAGSGIGALLLAVLVIGIVMKVSNPTDAVAIIGAVATPIVSIVTAYFGIQASAKATEDAHDVSRQLVQQMSAGSSDQTERPTQPDENTAQENAPQQQPT